MFLKTKMQALH
uniref:Uncharacterized protein n=1 Tax=Arundo donax TaxID=35708 RepID=A0A0A9BEB2_ARUDO